MAGLNVIEYNASLLPSVMYTHHTFVLITKQEIKTTTASANTGIKTSLLNHYMRNQNKQ